MGEGVGVSEGRREEKRLRPMSPHNSKGLMNHHIILHHVTRDAANTANFMGTRIDGAFRTDAKAAP